MPTLPELREPPKPPGIMKKLFNRDRCWGELIQGLDGCVQDGIVKTLSWQKEHGNFSTTDGSHLQTIRQQYTRAKTDFGTARKSSVAQINALEARNMYIKFREHSLSSCTRVAEQRSEHDRYLANIERRAKPNSLQTFRNTQPAPGIPNCLFELRLNVVKGLKRWFSSLEAEDRQREPENSALPTTPRIHLLKGAKGSGKSVLLHAIGKVCSKMEVLGASYVFTRQLTPQDFQNHFVPTIVHEIVRGFMRGLQEPVQNMDINDDLFLKSISFQTSNILVSGYQAVAHHRRGPASKLLLIFDGLDDCDPRVLEYFLEFMDEAIKGIPHIYFIIGSSLLPNVAGLFRREGLMEKLEVTEIGDFRTLLQEWEEAHPPKDQVPPRAEP